MFCANLKLFPSFWGCDVYSVNEYQISIIDQDIFLFHETKAAKISNPTLKFILESLKSRLKNEISEEELSDLAHQHNVNLEQLKKILVEQLDILRPLYDRKFTSIYINSDDSLIAASLSDTLSTQYPVHVVPETFADYPENSLVVFYRNNYTSDDFNSLYPTLSNNRYVITAGIVGKLLVIDNIYFKGSGLPTHFSNLQQLYTSLDTGLESPKDNWLVFYRTLVRSKMKGFPEPVINPCERGFVIYCVYKFTSQFTDFWSTPLTTDQLNWFWHVDLKKSTICKEVAIHSPYSEFDMNLNLEHLNKQIERV